MRERRPSVVEVARSQNNELISQIMEILGIDSLTVDYALSTRNYEIGGSLFDNDMIKATRATIFQRSQQEQARFGKALDVARELFPGETKIRF